MKSLKKFKNKLTESLLEILWKQWTALGVFSSVKEENHFLIDIESLIVLTLYIGKFDQRLFSAMFNWIIKNREWINASRIKSIGKVFYMDKKIIPRELINFAVDVEKKGDLESIKTKYLKNHNITFDSTYRNILNNLSIRDISQKPVLNKTPLIQLKFRGIFGVNARAEILIYLLTHREGNSNQIAREISFDQKIVYRILERWVKSNFAGKEERARESLYFLKRKEEMKNTISENLPRYIDWKKLFLFFSKLLYIVDTELQGDDKYVTSSAFRDLEVETREIERIMGINFPESNIYEGASFFDPFTDKVIELLKELKSRPEPIH